MAITRIVLTDPNGNPVGAAGSLAGETLISGDVTIAVADLNALIAGIVNGIVDELESSPFIVLYAAPGAGADVDLVAVGGATCRRIIVGGNGTMSITVGGATTTIPANVLAISPSLDVKASHLIAAGTTATNVLVLW